MSLEIVTPHEMTVRLFAALCGASIGCCLTLLWTIRHQNEHARESMQQETIDSVREGFAARGYKPRAAESSQDSIATTVRDIALGTVIGAVLSTLLSLWNIT